MFAGLCCRQKSVLRNITREIKRLNLTRTMASGNDKFGLPDRYKGSEKSVW
jgi:hypothetical protein